MVNDDSQSIILNENSLYGDGYFVTFDDGTQILQRDIEDYSLQPGDNIVTVGDGENLDTLAFDQYFSSKLWYKIADANRVFNPFEIDSGSSLIIPKLV